MRDKEDRRLREEVDISKGANQNDNGKNMGVRRNVFFTNLVDYKISNVIQMKQVVDDIYGEGTIIKAVGKSITQLLRKDGRYLEFFKEA